MPYLIDQRTFPERRDVAVVCSAILERGVLTPKEDRFVRELLKGHPGYARIVGPGLARIVVGTNSFGDRCFFAERSDGSQTLFSFLTCITARFRVGRTTVAA